MVKLDGENGDVFLSPTSVGAIRVAGAPKWSVVAVGGVFVEVKGTPDEVHAKLFPTAPPTEGQPLPGRPDSVRLVAAIEVARWVASDEVIAETEPPGWVVALARKALGLGGYARTETTKEPAKSQDGCIWNEPAAIHVLRWVLTAKDLAGLPPVIVEKARKALGLEGT